MTLTPELLMSWAVRRLRAADPELAARADLSDPQKLLAAKELLAGRAADSAGADLACALAVCVLADLDLAGWIRETCRFAFAVPSADGARWRSAFTRTVFLSGRPANMEKRFAFRHVAADGTAAWIGPAPAADTATLRRLLKTFQGPRPLDGLARGAVIELPGGPGFRPPVHRELHAATAGVTVAAALVHINHLLVEAVLDGLVAPGDRLTLRWSPRLTAVHRPVAALRVDADALRPDRLQAFALLTEEF